MKRIFKHKEEKTYAALNISEDYFKKFNKKMERIIEKIGKANTSSKQVKLLYDFYNKEVHTDDDIVLFIFSAINIGRAYEASKRSTLKELLKECVL